MSTIVEIAQQVREEAKKLHLRLDRDDVVLEKVVRDLSEDEIDALLAEFQSKGQYVVGEIPFGTFGGYISISNLDNAILRAKQAILFAAFKRLIDITWGSDFAAKLKYLQGIA